MTHPPRFIVRFLCRLRKSGLANLKPLLLASWMGLGAVAVASPPYVSTEDGKDRFPLVAGGVAAPLCFSSADFPGVLRVAGHLQADIARVTGIRARTLSDAAEGDAVVIIGTIGKSPVIDRLIRSGKIDAGKVAGRWDTYALQTVEQPLPGVERALVIFGSNKRGTIYGMYDLSKEIGVSPWHWWADVPPHRKDEIFVKPGFHSPGEPKVKYRGIFINDERPCMARWVHEKFGGWNHEFYDHVFELIMRNRGNYLWPAMWYEKGSDWNVPAFFADDPENHRLADMYGVVVSTSHHEPMMRAHHEWHRGNHGSWDYSRNREELKSFWREGIERMGNLEGAVTLGMRGDGDWDIPGGMQAELLEGILEDQREIIEDVTGRPAGETPQVWAVYKEVQALYDQGVRPPDDVTVLFCDDNFGNIKCLPKEEDLHREGGFGVYYHFDYVGSPRSYKWANVTQIERVWEQMKLAYDRGTRRLWIVNVGDIKPHEFPTSFWFDLAWNPEAITADELPNYYRFWAEQQFGPEHAGEIGEILSLLTKYNARRAPEMLEPKTYSLENYREADRVVRDFKALAERANAVSSDLPERYQSSFYQLVLFPVEACANLNEMNVTAARNRFYVDRGAARTARRYAERTTELFFKHEKLHRTMHELEDGKWNHMFAQPHIGQRHWHSSTPNNMPPISYTHASGKSADLAYHIENGTGRANFEPFDGLAYEYHEGFPVFDPVNAPEFYVEVFNKGDDALSYTLKPQQDWIKVSKSGGTVSDDEKVFVSIDWNRAPKGRASGSVVLSGAKRSYSLKVPIRNDLGSVHGFAENQGVVSIEAASHQRAIDGKGWQWLTIPNLGRTGSAVTMIPQPGESPFLPDREKPGSGRHDIVIEAEDGELGRRWRKHRSVEASGGWYIEADPTTNHAAGSPKSEDEDHVVSYEIPVTKSGDYAFCFRMLSDNASDDSFFWRVDDGSWRLENGRFGRGAWFRSGLGPLKRGEHVLQVAYRENGTRIDQVALSHVKPMQWDSDSPHLEYDFTLFDAAEVGIAAYLAPSHNFDRGDGLKFAMSIDDSTPQVVNLHDGGNWWTGRVSDRIAIETGRYPELAAGSHTLKIWMVDAGIVFEKFVIDAGGLKASYLGPPESVYVD